MSLSSSRSVSTLGGASAAEGRFAWVTASSCGVITQYFRSLALMGNQSPGLGRGIVDPPFDAEGFARRQPAKAVSGVESVRWSGHRFHGHGAGPSGVLGADKNVD